MTTAEIKLGNIAHNLDQVRLCLTPRCKILAVVKANAYGHGMIPIARELEAAGVDMLGVAFADEGISLRMSGINAGILVMAGISETHIHDLIKWRLTPVVYNLSLARALAEAAMAADTALPVHIKVDTGMRRIGVEPDMAAEFAGEISRLKGLEIEGVMTHFAEADLQNREFVQEQLERFMTVCKDIEGRGIKIQLRHTANSAAVIDMKETHLDMVRPGIMLYGYAPSTFPAAGLDLRRVMTLKSSIVHLKKVPPKTGISYGRIFTTSSETMVATIPVGYADGFSRSLSNKGHVLIRGRRVPVIGRVCMDMTMIDVTSLPDVSCGDEVIIVGEDRGACITADDIAGWAGTISYEILCGVGERVERVYVR